MSLAQNKFKITAGCFGLLLFIEGIVLVLARAEFGRQQNRLRAGHRALTALQNRAVFPSADNVKLLEQNLEELEFRTGELAAVMQRDPFPPAAVDAADFSARAQGSIERFRKRADAAGVFVPESLEVGFAQYASGGAVPEAGQVPRLSRQLYSVRRVVEVMARAGVESIDELTRDIFEAQPDVPQDSTHRRARREAPVSKVRKAKPPVEGPGGLYGMERVGITFTAREKVVWEVLNLFASMPHCMVITEFAHQTRTEILSYNPESVKQGGADSEATRRYLAGGILTGNKALSRPERLIAGDEPIQVKLLVDVYNFDEDGGRDE